MNIRFDIFPAQHAAHIKTESAKLGFERLYMDSKRTDRTRNNPPGQKRDRDADGNFIEVDMNVARRDRERALAADFEVELVSSLREN